MNALDGLLKFLSSILRTLLFDSWKSLFALFDRLEDRIERMRRRKKLPGRQGKASPHRCIPVDHPALKHPDPLIYDQYYLMSLGKAVTWDNPDIQLYDGGVPVPSHNLKPGHPYEIVARIWNGSTDAPVLNLDVEFSYLSFGIGTKNNPLGVFTVPELGVKGGPNCPAFAKWTWTTPSAGHYCIQANIVCFDDANPLNNLGQENTTVGKAHSPVDLEFALRNAGDHRHEYHFVVDSYVVPRPPPCQAGTRHRQGDGGRHDATNFPLPAGWTIAFNPPTPVLDPGNVVDIIVTVTPPAGFSKTQALNVNAFTENMEFAGGVTLYVEGA